MTQGPPHRNGSRLQVDVIPAKRPRFLGADASQQAQDDIRAQPGTLRGLQQGSGLLGGQRLTRPAPLALRRIDQRGRVVVDVTVGLGWRRARVSALCATSPIRVWDPELTEGMNYEGGVGCVEVRGRRRAGRAAVLVQQRREMRAPSSCYRQP